MFVDWCRVQGVVMPSVQFPATFENGVTGLRCLKKIEHREAFMFVPKKMMYTVDHVINNPVLKSII